MKQRSLLVYVFFAFALLLGANSVQGQGITTAAINGRVLDDAGDGLPGATVVAVHTPSGTRYGTATRPDGRYNLNGLRTGGPYTVTFSFVGFQDQTVNDIFLKLGQNLTIDIDLKEGVTLDEISVVASRGDIFDRDRTGASTTVTKETINSLPSISRSISDFTRLNPQASTAGSGTSFAGANNRYNQFSIDGTVNNDVFGLASSGTNGGQTGTQPISLDAIEEIQVAVAPYDVRQGGFTGGGINAITRSGTNDYNGSVYYFFNNEGLAGKTPTDDPEAERTRLDAYSDYQAGLRIGGPIVKDKLFFFFNAEVTERTQPTLFNVGEGSNVAESDLIAIQNKLEEITGGYDGGGFGPFENTNETQKFFIRFDWNISDKHTLTLRHNYVNSEELDLGRSDNTLTFNDGAITFPSTTNTTVLELQSRFSNNVSNELRVGYTTVRDDRDPTGTPFPYVRIQLENRTAAQIGSERFSTANRLFQDIFTITDNLTWYKGKHAITVGTHNEFYAIENVFIRENFGAYRYDSLEAFLAIGTANELPPQQYDLSYSLVAGEPQWAAEFGAAQLGFYIQDEYTVNNNLKLTGGLRVDIPIFFDEPTANPDFNNNPDFNQFGVATNQMPDTRLLFAPRLGFNWDVNGDGSTQVRGGVGVFTGRVPFVWVSNQFSNTGIQIARLRARNEDDPTDPDFPNGDFPAGFTFSPDPSNQPQASDLGLNTFTSEINVIDPDFRFPQVFRTNIAVDQQLPFWGLIGTVELIYTRKINDINYVNLNLDDENAAGNVAGADGRPYYDREEVSGDFTDVLLLNNTDQGYSYNVTTQLRKPFTNGFEASIAYTYGQSRDINGGTSSQAFSNWRFIENTGNPNDIELGFADFDVRSRIMASVSYRKEYGNNFASSIGLFYNGQSGGGVTYIYDGDVNGDGQFSNDLIYVPRDASEITLVQNGDLTPAQQWAALDEFIEDDPYLSGIRGDYAKRNARRSPFEHQFDLRLMQEFFIETGNGKRNTLQITFDMFNVGNFINKDWGRDYNVRFNTFQLLEVEGVVDNGNGTFSPSFTFDPATEDDIWNINQFTSRWRAQLGFRYIFQ